MDEFILNFECYEIGADMMTIRDMGFDMMPLPRYHPLPSHFIAINARNTAIRSLSDGMWHYSGSLSEVVRDSTRAGWGVPGLFLSHGAESVRGTRHRRQKRQDIPLQRKVRIRCK